MSFLDGLWGLPVQVMCGQLLLLKKHLKKNRHKHIAWGSFTYTHNYLHAHNPKREKECKFIEVNDVKINKNNQGEMNDHN